MSTGVHNNNLLYLSPFHIKLVPHLITKIQHRELRRGVLIAVNIHSFLFNGIINTASVTFLTIFQDRDVADVALVGLML